MGFWNASGRLLWGATKLAAKGTAATTVFASKVAAKGAAAVGTVVYNNRESIGNAAVSTAKVVAKATVATAKVAGAGTAYVAAKAYNNRDVIAGAGMGVIEGTANVVADVSAHVRNVGAVERQIVILRSQGGRYATLSERVKQNLSGPQSKELLLDSLIVGGQTLAEYIKIGTVSPDIQQAYELAYPDSAADHSFLDEVRHLDGAQLVGFTSGIKGKLFEVEYVAYLNDGHLPAGYHADLAHSPTNPGWDLAIYGPDDSVREVIQLKATDSVAYVHEALRTYPTIDVVTTDEVHSHLVMLGAADHVAGSGISNQALAASVDGGVDQVVGSMHWTPSVLSLALIAYSAYNADGLSNYQKSKSFGERSIKSYVAYVAGGSLAVATGTWWIGMLGGIGSRMLLGSGCAKRTQLAQLRSLVDDNEGVLQRLQNRLG
jgi:hypothetical protein